MQNATQEFMPILKLKQLVASRFGKSLEVRQLMGVSSGGEAQGFVIKGHDLHIPIQVKDQLLGTAIVNGAWDMEKETRDDLSQVVRLVLEPTMYNWYLERKENNLNQLASAQFPTDNLQIFGEKMEETLKDHSSSPTLEEILAAADESLTKPQLLSNLVHLEGKNLMMVKKISLQIHEMSNRWAFVPFKDIKDQLSSVIDILKMGAMTIFVDDILSLTAKDQDLLLEYIGSARSSEEPLIITSSPLQISELSGSDLHPHLVDELEINSFEVDRAPLGYHNLKEMLELFLLRDSDFKV